MNIVISYQTCKSGSKKFSQNWWVKNAKSDIVSATGAHQSASDVKACHKPTLKQAMSHSVLWCANGDLQDFSQASPEKNKDFNVVWSGLSNV